jgi:phosphoglycerate dehydrogenase-like enzyme
LVVQRARGRRCWALEGTGCYGAGLASFLADQGEWVTEIDRPKRTGRTQAKSDPLDAIRAGREALSREHLACPRQRGQREALRVLQVTKAGAVKVAADARRHLKALLVTAPESWVVAGATLAVAALFQPARRRIQAVVDRRSNRRKYDAHRTVEAFSARLRDEVDLDALLAELLAVADQTMQPTTTSLWLRQSAKPR